MPDQALFRRIRHLALVPTLIALGACGSGAGGSGGGTGGSAGGGSALAAGLCPGESGIARPEHWALQTHCPGVDPDYAEVFGEGVVRRVDVTVSATDYAAMMAFLEDNYFGGTGDLDALPTPLWVPATVRYGDQEWKQVGFRWKGHASLKGAWSAGVEKLAFALSFDELEDQYPELVDQRFYGFKKLSFSNAYHDPSFIRDKTAGSVFRAAGVPVARSSFAAVTLDRGSGPEYAGVYTIIEDPADEMLDAQLGGHDGNLYKPWGDAARWLSVAELGEAELETYFEKETFEDEGDWSDIIAALQALHADRTDPAAWRAGLEAVFDVPAFLKALAVSRVIMNWDSYGCMHHNYLLYADPNNGGRLRWLPWDLNESLMAKEWSGCPAPGSVMLDEIVNGDPSDIDAEVDADWPLIRFILGDEVYRSAYVAEVRAFLGGAFDPAVIIQQMRADHDLIAPYVIGPVEVEAYPFSNYTDIENIFDTSLLGGEFALETHISTRRAAVESELAGL